MKKQILAAAFATAIGFSSLAYGQIAVGIRVGPPAPRHEVRPAPPREHRDWVWRAGYYRHDGHDYVWVPGEYIEPPHARAVWVPGHWDRRDGGYFWVEGHWRG